MTTQLEDLAAPLNNGLTAQLDAAIAAWHSSGDFTEQTLLRSEETARRFARRITAQGVTTAAEITPEHCQGFLDAMTRDARPPELSTRHARRVALRMLFRTWRDLNYPVHDPTLDLTLPARSSRAARPLTDAEVTLGRTAARLGNAGSASLQRAVCWALAEATAVTSEVSAIRICDFDDPAEPRYVELPGTRRVDARVGELTDWGNAVVKRQLALLRQRRCNSQTLITYRGAGAPGQHVAQAAVCNAISGVLADAGLGQESDVRPASVRNWAARRLFDAGMPLDRVALRLGARSLDSVAEDIALEWRARP